MKFLNASKRKMLSSVTASFLVLSFILVPISETLEIKRAEAQTVFDPANFIQNSVTAIKTAVSAVSDATTAAGVNYLSLKEGWLDGIAWQLINIVLKEMIRSVTAWVKSGFQGSPAFLTNFEGFMTDVADKAAGNFIWGNEALRFLCSPYALNIKLALSIQYNETRAYEAQCTLSGVIRNTEQFLSGDFRQGGWDGWYEVTMNPQNNIYGSMLQAQQGLYASVGSAQFAQQKLLDFGNGFFSIPDPNCRANPDNPDEFDASRCGIVTPGAVTESILNDALGGPQRRVEVADEINELIGALFSQLAGEVLGGASGLLGLTDSNPAYGGFSYFDQIAQEQSALGYASESNQTIQTSIDDETRYLGFQQTIVTLIRDAEGYKNRNYPDREVEDDDGDIRIISQCSVGGLTLSLSQKLITAEREVASSTALIGRLNVFLSDYNSLTSSTTPQSVLNVLLVRYGATSVAGAQSNLSQQYLSYQTSGALHTAGDVVNVELSTIPSIRTEIATFTASIDSACEDDDN